MKVMPRGRMTIRPSANPLEPVDGRVNRRINFWEFPEAEPGSALAKVEGVYFGALESVDSTRSARELAATNPNSNGRDRTIVVDLENSSPHEASEVEMAGGRFFKDYDEYVATNGEPVVRRKNIFA